ncbi:hypothetical protein MPSI1_001506 [Malassezia psittaci]|uniref:Trafficking protein particle complex subunit BET3 n=1 Tax=Malassezia psittaci TaxID=1821823 RepID=A0AAF0JJU7_9BASI|nr:hypothetical protein MPSI1_001506 [Malassezia psittaci]
MATKQYKTVGEELWKQSGNKVNLELFTLTYGSLVVQLIKDYEDYEQVNLQLDKINLPRCTDFREVAEVIMSFASNSNADEPAGDASIRNSSTTHAAAGEPDSSNAKEFSLLLPENPLAEFVELPAEALQGGLQYSNVLAGVIRGALEMVQIQTQCEFVSDTLRGDEVTELRVKLIRYLEEEAPPADD